MFFTNLVNGHFLMIIGKAKFITSNNCQRRIACSYHVFQKWLTERILEEHEVFNYTTHF